jgi:hypothetical protein
MKFINRPEGATPGLAAPPGLDLIPHVAAMAPKRSWADVVKSQRYGMDTESMSQKLMEQSSQSADTDGETQADSSFLGSDVSDSESSVGDSPSLNPAVASLKLDLNDLINFEQEYDVSEKGLPAPAYIDIDSRLRGDAPVFVPMSMVAATTMIAPPPGLRTSLRSQAKAFVPGAW